MLTIGYLSEADTDYANALTVAGSLESLRALVSRYKELAVDAEPLVMAMTPKQFSAFRRGLLIERRGKFAGERWAMQFGSILLPMPMMQITQVAWEFKCPFGVAYHRMKETGQLSAAAIRHGTH
jgi:hypothetical protein